MGEYRDQEDYFMAQAEECMDGYSADYSSDFIHMMGLDKVYDSGQLDFNNEYKLYYRQIHEITAYARELQLFEDGKFYMNEEYGK